MSDTQAAMREFSFLEEKRARGELSDSEGQRWYELRDFLGLSADPSYADQQQYGYYASDGNWYPYPLDEYGRPYDPNAVYATEPGYGYDQPQGAAAYPSDTGYAQPGYDPNVHGHEATTPAWSPSAPTGGYFPPAPEPERNPMFTDADLDGLGPPPEKTSPSAPASGSQTQPSWPHRQVPSSVPEATLAAESLASDGTTTQIWHPPSNRSAIIDDDVPTADHGDITQVGAASTSPVVDTSDLEPLIPASPEPVLIPASSEPVPEAPEPLGLEPLTPAPQPASEPLPVEPLGLEPPTPAPDPLEPAPAPAEPAFSSFEPAPRPPLSLDDFSSADTLPPTPPAGVAAPRGDSPSFLSFEPAPLPSFEAGLQVPSEAPPAAPEPERAPSLEPVAIADPTPEPELEPVAIAEPTPEPEWAAPEQADALAEPQPVASPKSSFSSFEPEPLPSLDALATREPAAAEVEAASAAESALWDAPVAPAEPVLQLDAADEATELDSREEDPSSWGAVPEPELPVLDLAEADLSSGASMGEAEPSIVLAPDLQAELEIIPMAQAINAGAFDVDASDGAPELNGSPDDAIELATASEFIISDVGHPPAPARERVAPVAPPAASLPPPPPAPAPSRPAKAAPAPHLPPDSERTVEVERGGLFGSPGSFDDTDGSASAAEVDWSEPKPAPPPPPAAKPPARAVPPPPVARPPPPPPPLAEEPPLEEIELLEEAVPEPSSAGVSAFITGEHRVIIHTIEGQVKRGVIRDVDLMDESIPLELQLGVAPERLATDRLKAIFFMQPAGARPAPVSGQKIRVTFKDGRQVAGFSEDFTAPDRGFFVVPADQRTNTARIYIYRTSIQGVAEG